MANEKQTRKVLLEGTTRKGGKNPASKTPRPTTPPAGQGKTLLYTSVKVRIEGKTEQHVQLAAKEMNVLIKRIYPMRSGTGFMAYGFRRVVLK
jgi:hypothetical protein